MSDHPSLEDLKKLWVNCR